MMGECVSLYLYTQRYFGRSRMYTSGNIAGGGPFLRKRQIFDNTSITVPASIGLSNCHSSCVPTWEQTNNRRT